MIAVNVNGKDLNRILKSRGINLNQQSFYTNKNLQNLGAVLLFFLVGASIYSNIYQSPFVFDDLQNIVDNPNMRLSELSFKNLYNAAFKTFCPNRPVANITFALNYYFHGYHLWGYHLVNILIHIFNGILLFFLFKLTLEIYYKHEEKNKATLTNSAIIALSASLLWFVNPLQTQAVTYIVQRMTSIATLFYILSLLMYVKGRQKTKNTYKYSYFAISCLSALLAFSSKEITLTLPVFISLYELFFIRNLKIKWTKQYLYLVIPAIGIIICIAWFFLGSTPVERILASYATRDFTLTQRVLTEFRVVIFYLSLLFFPQPSRLNLTHDFPISNSIFNPATTGLSLFFLVVIFSAAVFFAKKNRLLAFAIFWYMGNLIIESSVIGLEIIFEHRTYLPSAFLGLAIVAMLDKYIQKINIKLAIIIMLVCILSFWTYERNKVWESRLTIWEDCLKKSPNNERICNNLGEAYLQNENFIKAAYYFQKAIEINPEYAIAIHNYGCYLMQIGEYDKAAPYFIKSINLDRYSFAAFLNLGKIYSENRDFEKAKQFFNMSLRLNNSINHSAYHHLGIISAEETNYEKAVEYFNKALAINPESFDINLNMGRALAKQRKFNASEKHFIKAISVTKHLAETYREIGLTISECGNLKKGLLLLKTAMNLKPDNIEFESPYNELKATIEKFDNTVIKIDNAIKKNPGNYALYFQKGNIYEKIGDLENTEENFSAALKIKPDSIEVLNSLGILMIKQQKPKEAIEYFEKIYLLSPKNNEVCYTIACLYSKDNNKEKAVFWLKKAVKTGYNNWENVRICPDLENIRDTEYFHMLIKQERLIDVPSNKKQEN